MKKLKIRNTFYEKQKEYKNDPNSDFKNIINFNY